MTKEEKAVLAACDMRLDKLMVDFGLPTPHAVLKAQKGKNTPAARLIRACAKWRIARERK